MAITIEFLKGLGFDEEAIKKIMAERGKEVEKTKLELEQMQKEVNETKSNLETLAKEAEALKSDKSTAEEFKKKYEELQVEIKKRAEEEKKAKDDELLTKAILDAFGDKKDNFASDYVKNGLISDMKDEINKEENKGKGYAELFEALTKDKEGIFKNPNPPEIPPASEVVADISDDFMRSVMGLSVKKD